MLIALIALLGIVATYFLATLVKNRRMLHRGRNAHGNDFPRSNSDSLTRTSPSIKTIPAPERSPQDALSEAGVYLAYGRTAEAQRVLTEALAIAPGNMALERKLRDIQNAPASAAHAVPRLSPQAESPPTPASPTLTKSAPATPLPLDPAAPLEFDVSALPGVVEKSEASGTSGPTGQSQPSSPQADATAFPDLDVEDERDSRLTLAREFLRIGDLEHARSIAMQILRDPQAQRHDYARQLLAHLDKLEEQTSHP